MASLYKMLGIWLCIGLLACSGATASQPLDAASSISNVQRLLMLHGKTAVISGRLVVKYDQYIQDINGCSITLVTSELGGYGAHTKNYSISLSKLSPNVKVNPWNEYNLFIVRVDSSSGEKDIPFRTTLSDSAKQIHRFELVFSDEKVAFEISNQLGIAIRLCGGTEQSSIAANNVAAIDSAQKAKVDNILGKSIPDSARNLVISQCHARVRSKLKSPDSAKFDSNISVLPIRNGTELLVTGKFEGQNSYGGFLQSTYICDFEIYGNQYIPKDAVVQ